MRDPESPLCFEAAQEFPLRARPAHVLIHAAQRNASHQAKLDLIHLDTQFAGQHDASMHPDPLTSR